MPLYIIPRMADLFRGDGYLLAAQTGHAEFSQ